MITNGKVPKLCNNDGRAFSIWPGTKKREYFGRYGDPEATAKHKRWVERLIAGAKRFEDKPVITGPAAIVDLSVEYIKWAKEYFKGKGDFLNVRRTQKLLVKEFGLVLAESFGPNRFREFQGILVGRGLSRSTVNAHMGRARRFFKWCQSRELTPRGHYEDLKSVASLMPGRSAAPESPPIQPIPWEVVAKTLPHLPPPVALAVRVQYLCGMRPNEVLQMRAGEIDQAGPVWFWRPRKHKNSHRLKSLTKAIPATAQLLLKPLLASKADGEFLFSPADAAEWRASRKPPRKTKVYPCEKYRVRDTLKGRKLLDHYTALRYGKEIRDAIRRANKNIQEESGKIPHWTPNQLRHAIATEVSALLGEQASQRWMGHAHLSTTGIYTAVHERELREIAEKLDQHLPR